MKRIVYYAVVFVAFVAFGTWYFVNFEDIYGVQSEFSDISFENISDNVNDTVDKNEFSTENSSVSKYLYEKININTADEIELVSIDGIGIKRAEDIIEYRNKNGNFSTIEDIMNVSGIGEATFNKIKNYITV